MVATSSKCCTRSPEGPAAVPFGNDLKTDKMSKSALRKIVSDRISGATGVGSLGCLAFNCCQVDSLLGAIPPDSKTWQAFPIMPDLALEIARSMRLLEEEVFVLTLDFTSLLFAMLQSDSTSLSNHLLHKDSLDGAGCDYHSASLKGGHILGALRASAKLVQCWSQ